MARVVHARSAVIVFVLLALATVVPSAGAAGLTADYRFAGNYLSSVPGAPALTPLGQGVNAFVTESVEGSPQTVLSFPEGNGVSLASTTQVAPNDAYTIAVLARLTRGVGLRRYVDFKNGTSDTGLFQLNGMLTFSGYPAGPLAVIRRQTYALVVLTRSAGGQLVGYLDGVQQFSFDDSSSAYAVITPQNVLRFFRDAHPVGGINESAGAVARISIWDGPLTAAEVAGLRGPVATPPPPVLGRAVDARTLSGRLRVVLPAPSPVSLPTPLGRLPLAGFAPAFVPAVVLAQPSRLPVGTIVDARVGVARITTATDTGGAVQSGDFGGSVFRISQQPGGPGLTELGVVIPPSARNACVSPASARTARRRSRPHLPAKILALLRASVKGSFRTRGRFSSATVRGTRWDTLERCDGTLTRVYNGLVAVRDIRLHRRLVLRAGQSYLARAGYPLVPQP